MSTIFELSSNWKLSVENFMDSDIIIIDNFYKRPDLVKKFSIEPLPSLWKAESKETRNGCFYQDRRLQATMEDSNIDNTVKILSQLVGQSVIKEYPTFVTNATKFYRHSFNDIDNNYWWPHIDSGYNAIVFLNDEIVGEYSGTALYHPDDVQLNPPPEGTTPWISKTQYRLVKHVPGKYNRCVLFDGLKFPHAMHINDYTFFDDFYRVNHVYFFKPHD